MRLRACPGFILLGLTACQTLPSTVRVEIDDSSLQFHKNKPEPPALPAPETPASNQSASDDRAR